jgi:hypothetical protein
LPRSQEFFGVYSDAVAEYEKTMVVLKLRGAREGARAKHGRCESRRPYGHYEGEAEIIDRMKGLRASGLGFDRIVAQLNAEGADRGPANAGRVLWSTGY